VSIEILLAVIIRKLGASGNPLARENKYAVAWPYGLAVACAGVVDVPSNIFSNVSIDGFVFGNLEEILARVAYGDLFTYWLANVLNDTDTLWNIFLGEEAFAGLRPPHP